MYIFPLRRLEKCASTISISVVTGVNALVEEHAGSLLVSHRLFCIVSVSYGLLKRIVFNLVPFGFSPRSQFVTQGIFSFGLSVCLCVCLLTR